MHHSLRFVLTGWLLSATIAVADENANVLEQAPSHFAPFGELKVHYKSLGEGTTAVVFIHGWCCDHTVWHHQAAALNGKVRLLFVDLPGFGQSDQPKIDYTMDVFAKGIDAVLQDANVEHAILVGHSMGTPVVRQFYRLFPDKTKALIFVDGGLRPFTDDPAETERFMSMFQEETFKDFAPQFLTAMLPPDTPAAMREHITEMVNNTKPQIAISSMRGMVDANLWKDDPIRVPAQALMAESPFWDDDYKDFVKKLVPDLDYREFEGVGHFLFMEEPEPINEALVEFLNKQDVLSE